MRYSALSAFAFFVLLSCFSSCRRENDLGPFRHFEINGSTLDNTGRRGNITIKVLKNGLEFQTTTSSSNANYNIQFTDSIHNDNVYKIFVFESDSMAHCLDTNTINLADLRSNTTDLKFEYEFNFTVTYYTWVHFHVKNTTTPFDVSDRLDSLGRLGYYMNNPFPGAIWIDDLTGPNVDTIVNALVGRTNQDIYYFKTKNGVRSFVTQSFPIGENDEDVFVNVLY